jgi:hypothetical protein
MLHENQYHFLLFSIQPQMQHKNVNIMHTSAISTPDIKFPEGAGVVVESEGSNEFAAVVESEGSNEFAAVVEGNAGPVVTFVNACEIIKIKHNVIAVCFSIGMIIQRRVT